MVTIICCNMERIDELLKAALLGSEKVDLASMRNRLPDEIQQQQAQLSPGDAEEAFLQLSASVLPYYRAGQAFPTMDSAPLALAPEEEAAYASEAAHQPLAIILADRRRPLLIAWLEECARRSLIVLPPFLPTLLALGQDDVALQMQLAAVMGQRGAWLAGLNEAWRPMLAPVAERWETEKSAPRKQLFRYLIRHRPSQAKALLQATWKEENAADRFEFLDAWAEHVVSDDVPFLETLLADRSQKVRERVLPLLLRQPNSSLAQAVRQQCGSLLIARKKLLAKKTIEVNLALDLLPIVERLGLEKESLQKALSDQEYRVYQLLALADPKLWEDTLRMPPGKILQQFADDKALNKYADCFSAAIRLHQNHDWAEAWLTILPSSGRRDKSLINNLLHHLHLAPHETIVATLTALLKRPSWTDLYTANETFDLLARYDFAWSPEFSKMVLQEIHRAYAIRGIQYYETDKFLALAYVLHPSISRYQEEFLSAAAKKPENWSSALRELFRIVDLKTSISTAFNT